MSHHHTLIDTCVWLDLATDLVAEKIVEQLEQLINAKSFTLVVPAIIEEEFDRNKATCLQRLAGRLSGRVQETLKYAKEYGEPADKAVLVPALEAFLGRISNVSGAAEKMMERLERILRHPENKRIPISGELLELAARRGCEKKAPFINNKNSVADAVILEAFLGFVARHAEGQSCTFSFVTVNKSDFCDHMDKRNPHPELGEPFESGRVRFSINIAEEINTLVSSLLPAEARRRHLLSEEIVQHVGSWPGIGVEMSICPRCKEKAMEFIGGHPSQYGGWTVWQMCKKCGFKWDTGDFID